MEQNQFRIGAYYKQEDGIVVELLARPGMPEGVAWAKQPGSSCGKGFRRLGDGIDTSFQDGRNLIPGEVTERGEPIETAAAALVSYESAAASAATACTTSAAHAVAGLPPTPLSLGALLRQALERGIGKTPTLDALENTRDPKRAPLPYFTERAQFDPFAGFVTTSRTTDQPAQRSFGSFVSPDMQDNGPQTNPVFGSAALVVKG